MTIEDNKLAAIEQKQQQNVSILVSTGCRICYEGKVIYNFAKHKVMYVFINLILI